MRRKRSGRDLAWVLLAFVFIGSWALVNPEGFRQARRDSRESRPTRKRAERACGNFMDARVGARAVLGRIKEER